MGASGSGKKAELNRQVYVAWSHALEHGTAERPRRPRGHDASASGSQASEVNAGGVTGPFEVDTC